MLDKYAIGRTPIAVDDISPADGDALAELFNDFRLFYGRMADPAAARAFISGLIQNGTSRFFIAKANAEAVGFVHLLPYFDTLAMTKAWILEDLYVRPSMRRQGAGTALLRRAEQFARDTGAGRISLTTAHTNRTAQRLYEANGYRLDEVFRTYHVELL